MELVMGWNGNPIRVADLVTGWNGNPIWVVELVTGFIRSVCAFQGLRVSSYWSGKKYFCLCISFTQSVCNIQGLGLSAFTQSVFTIQGLGLSSIYREKLSALFIDMECLH